MYDFINKYLLSLYYCVRDDHPEVGIHKKDLKKKRKKTRFRPRKKSKSNFFTFINSHLHDVFGQGKDKLEKL